MRYKNCYGKQHKFPDSQAKSSCQNNQTQVLNTLQYGTSKGVDKICSLSRFFFTYFTIIGVKKIVRYIEDFVIQKFFISRFHCSDQIK